MEIREEVKVNSINYCASSDEGLVSWLDDQTLARRKKLIFTHDNVLSHSVRGTKEFLASLGINDCMLSV